MRDLALPIERIDETVKAELWFLDCEALSRPLDEEERRQPRLSASELRRAQEIRSDRDRRIWRVAHIGLRMLIERWCGDAYRRVPYEIATSGKPSLPRPAPVFNLAHAGDCALIGLIRKGPLGVDLQEIATRMVKGERRERMEDYATRIARGAALPENRDHRFVQAWTRIEALAKADGRGGIGKTLTEAGLIGGGPVGGRTSQIAVKDLAVRAPFAAAVAATHADWPANLGVVRDFGALIGREVV